MPSRPPRRSFRTAAFCTDLVQGKGPDDAVRFISLFDVRSVKETISDYDAVKNATHPNQNPE